LTIKSGCGLGQRWWLFTIIAGIGLLALSACGGSSLASAPTPSAATGTPTAMPPSPTSTPSPLPPSPTSTPVPPSPTPQAEPGGETPTATVPLLPANELGQVMVLEYHHIGVPEDRWQRTPDNFRADLEYLWAHGYYPVNLADFASGQMDVPAGKSPVVLTFDDSTISQFRYLDDGYIDPDCAVGILAAFHNAHPDDWPLRATFFVLPSVAFAQEGLGQRKLQELVLWGMEVGGHTVTHADLSKEPPDKVRWELAESERLLEGMIPGYEVRSLSLPYGGYPADIGLLASGESEGAPYDYQAAVKVGWGPNVSPYDASFDPYLINRIQVIPEERERWFGHFEQHPEKRFVSDGDPGKIAAPLDQ
jgi:peptidoglycan/xylan/chitin deacetylase (PgdA/CDA1 family)